MKVKELENRVLNAQFKYYKQHGKQPNTTIFMGIELYHKTIANDVTNYKCLEEKDMLMDLTYKKTCGRGRR